MANERIFQYRDCNFTLVGSYRQNMVSDIPEEFHVIFIVKHFFQDRKIFAAERPNKRIFKRPKSRMEEEMDSELHSVA